MNRFSVIIATTDGPVRVQRLAEEDPDVRSVICLNGTSEALPISGAYDAFVRKPTGVIERLFGHAVYRIDVSDRISDGRSWQLGVFAAHLLHNQGELAERNEDATHVLWLTGKVNNALDVGVVDHVAEKLERSAEMLSELALRGQKIVLAYPQDNEAEVARVLGEEKTVLTRDAVELLPVGSTDDLLGALSFFEGNVPFGSTGSEASMIDKTMSERMLRLSWVACALAVLVVGFIGWNMFGEIARWRTMAAEGTYDKLLRDLETTKTGACMICRVAAAFCPLVAGLGRAGKEDIELAASEVRPPDRQSCTSVRFATASPEEHPVLIQPDGLFAASLAEGLCGLVYRLKNAGSQPFHGWLSVRVRSGKLARTRNRGGAEHARLAPGEIISISIRIPEWLGSDVTYAVHAIADGVVSGDVTRWMAGSLGGRLNAPGLGELAMVHEVRLTGK